MKTEIKKGDLLLSRANTTALVGASVLVGSCRSRLVLSDKSLRLIPAPSVDKQWLQFALSSPSVRTQMSTVATGVKASMRNISQQKLRSIAIPLPAPAEQLRLAAEIDRRLSIVDDAARSVQTGIRKAADLRRSLLTTSFSGRLVPQDSTDEPAEVLLDRIKTERAAAPKRASRRHRSAQEEPAA